MPLKEKNAIIIRNYKLFYENFRLNVIRILLQSSGYYKDERQVRHLLDCENFKKYFSNNNKCRFYTALNNIQHNSQYINSLIVEFELLNIESHYMINNIGILNNDTYNFVKSLNENLFRIKNDIKYKCDQTKYLGNMLWSYLANYSMIKGYSNQDLFSKMLSGL